MERAHEMCGREIDAQDQVGTLHVTVLELAKILHFAFEPCNDSLGYENLFCRVKNCQGQEGSELDFSEILLHPTSRIELYSNFWFFLDPFLRVGFMVASSSEMNVAFFSFSSSNANAGSLLIFPSRRCFFVPSPCLGSLYPNCLPMYISRVVPHQQNALW